MHYFYVYVDSNVSMIVHTAIVHEQTCLDVGGLTSVTQLLVRQPSLKHQVWTQYTVGLVYDHE